MGINEDRLNLIATLVRKIVADRKLGASVLSLAQKRQMTDEILAAHAEWIRF